MFAKDHIGPYWAILGHFAIWAILRGMAQDGSGYLIMALAQDWLKTGSKYYKHHLCMVKHVVRTHITYTCITDHLMSVKTGLSAI